VPTILLGYAAHSPTKMSWLAGHEKHGHDESDNLGVDWVLQYEFGDIGKINQRQMSRIDQR
jgi:hypothetical protein